MEGKQDDEISSKQDDLSDIENLLISGEGEDDSLEIETPSEIEDSPEIEKESDESDIEDIDGDDEPEYEKNILTKNDMVSVHETYSEYYTGTKTTPPLMNKFERAKILGVRAQMLSSGANPLVKPPYSDNCYDIALRELKEKKIPLIIRRYLPDKTFEDWRIEDLIITN